MRGAAACLYLSRDEEGGCLPSRGHATRGAGCGECPCYPWSCPRVPMLSLVMSPCAHVIPGHVPVCRMVSLVMSPCAAWYPWSCPRVPHGIPGHVPVCPCYPWSCPRVPHGIPVMSPVCVCVCVCVCASVRACVRACVRDAGRVTYDARSRRVLYAGDMLRCPQSATPLVDD